MDRILSIDTALEACAVRSLNGIAFNFNGYSDYSAVTHQKTICRFLSTSFLPNSCRTVEWSDCVPDLPEREPGIDL